MATINPVPSKPNDLTQAVQILQAIGLAKNVFGSNSDEDQAKRRQLEIAEKDLLMRQNAQKMNAAERFTFMTPEQTEKNKYSGISLPEEVGAPSGMLAIPNSQIKYREDTQRALHEAELAKTKETEKTKRDLHKRFNKQYTSDKRINAVRTTLSGYKRIESAIRTPDPSGASDLVMINGFAKILDPTGAVRPSEFATAEEAMPFFRRYGADFLADKISRGSRLDEPTRKRMFNEAQRLTYGQLEIEDDVAKSYQHVADKYGLDVDEITDPSMDVWRDRIKQQLEQTGQMPMALPGSKNDILNKPIINTNFTQPNQSSGFDANDYIRKYQGE